MPDEYTRPDFKMIALVTIDVQRDFLDDGVCAIPGTTAVLPRIATLLNAFRAAHLPIIHVIRLYKADGSNVDLCRRAVVESGKAIAQPGTSGIQLATELLPRGAVSLDADLLLAGALQTLGDQEWVMYKSRWGAFYRTRLEDHLRTLRVTTVAFTGCNFPNCPRASIYEASERDFRVVLVDDALSGIYDRGKDELKSIGVSVMSSNDLSEAVTARAPSRHRVTLPP
jgi:nicotinamidase-related amidase